MIDRRDLGEPVIEPRQIGGPGVAREGLRLARNGHIVGRTRLAKQRLNVGIAQAVDKVSPAHRAFPPALHDLLQEPSKVFERLIAMREDPNRILDRHGADALQAAPHFYPEVVGLRRDLVEQEEPTSARCVSHRGATG